ncbi:MAG TPA: TonB family protein [Acidobacteriaceae bacterium]|nr:TonB family protein [Acidobacteriaceae bacterium]
MIFRRSTPQGRGLTTLFDTDASRPRGRGSVAASCAAHGVALALVYLALHAGRAYPTYTESRCCSTALYWSPSAANSGAKPQPVAHKVQRAPSSVAAAKPKIAEAPAAAMQQAATQTGMSSPQQLATLGTGDGSENAEPALPLYYPSPGITDRSLLPVVKQNIVVDVNISAMGDVTDEKLVRGLGNALDQLVLATVKSWRFHPATVNGTAVASVEELVFPFDQGWEPNDAAGSG